MNFDEFIAKLKRRFKVRYWDAHSEDLNEIIDKLVGDYKASNNRGYLNTITKEMEENFDNPSSNKEIALYTDTATSFKRAGHHSKGSDNEDYRNVCVCGHHKGSHAQKGFGCWECKCEGFEGSEKNG